MQIEKIILYPVKSMAGYPVDMAKCDRNGLAGDRRFVVTRPDGQFLTARQFPSLMTLKPRLLDNGNLEITGPDGSIVVETPQQPTGAQVTIWKDSADAGDCGDAAAAFLSDFLGKPARLRAISGNGKRVSETNRYVPDSFADAMPLLVLSQESIDAINTHFSDPVTWRNFRPNILLSGAEQPFAEDLWASINIGSAKMDLVYGSARCVMTTVNPKTGTFRTDKEPMLSLKTYRRADDRQIYVGQNAVITAGDTVKVGDPVTVAESRDRNILQKEVQ